MSLMPFGPLPHCGRLLYRADGLSCSCPACPGDFNVTMAPPPCIAHPSRSTPVFMVCLHVSFVFLFSFLSDLAVAADFSETEFNVNVNVSVAEDLKGERKG